MIVVFGSINVDLVARVERLPGPGETVKGPEYQVFPGGRAPTRPLPRAAPAHPWRWSAPSAATTSASAGSTSLVSDGVDVSDVATVGAPTGIAMIAVDRGAENMIIVASGANRLAAADSVARRVGDGDTLVLQFEVPEGAVLEAARAASGRGGRVIVNAAPPAPSTRNSPVTRRPDRQRTRGGRGRPWHRPARGADRLRPCLRRRSGGAVVVTLGADGAFAAEGDAEFRVPSPKVEVLDTTAAGDAFVGALAAALDRGADLRQAVIDGVAAGSLAVEAFGAQPSLPRARGDPRAGGGADSGLTARHRCRQRGVYRLARGDDGLKAGQRRRRRIGTTASRPLRCSHAFRLVLSTAVAGTLIAAMVPEIRALMDRRATAEGSTVAVTSAPQSAGARLGDVVIPADGQGHFRVTARVRGPNLAFLADTGATVVALRASDAARLGLRPMPADYTVPIETANGRVLGASARLDALEVGSIRVAGVDALVLPDKALGGNLLGMSFLKRLRPFRGRRRSARPLP